MEQQPSTAEQHIVVLPEPFYGSDAAIATCRATFGDAHDQAVAKHGKHYPCGVGY